MPQWTAEQEAAIFAHGASLVVSAAAGSGKTAVLVERVIRLLSDEENRTPAEGLVVVTFTNDAAAEVRSRMTNALNKRLLDHPDSQWLRRQQVMLQSAEISTIHSFCYPLMREHCAKLDISADFRVMDAQEELLLKAQAVRTVLEQFSRRADEDETVREKQKLLFDAFCVSDDTPLEDLLLSLYDCIENTPFGGDLARRSAAQYESGAMLEAAFAEFGRQLEDIRMLYANALEQYLPYASEKSLEALQNEIALADQLADALEHRELQRLSVLLGVKPEGSFRPGKSESVRTARALRKHAKDLLDALKERWRVPFALAESDLSRHAAILHAVSGLLDAFADELRAQKQARNAISFSDAMSMTLSLVAERCPDGTVRRTPLAEELSAKYACIMVDEFQDADDQQDLIFRMLSKGGSAACYGSNLFIVGDSKQCIYRFRNANPANFSRAVRESVSYREPQLTDNTNILLRHNFRCAEEVICFVNHVFSSLMTEQTGEILYDEAQALRQGMVFPRMPRPVELIPVETAGNRRADTASAAAARIRQHLSGHTQVFDPQAEGGLRDCRPGDFMILLRTKTHMDEYIDALSACGIPVCGTEHSGLLSSPEVTLLLHLLRVIDNPLLDLSAAAAMLSPLFGFSLDDLTQIRVSDRRHELFTVMLSVQKDPPADFSEALLKKIGRFLTFLSEMRLFSAMETPERIIRRVCEKTDFIGMTQMLPDSAQKKINLRTLAVHAKTFTEQTGGDLSAFLRFADSLTERNQDLSVKGAASAGTDAVRVMTIHGSKGLEAPFVILGESDTKFSHRDEGKTVQFHPALGLAFKLNDPGNYSGGDTLPSVTAAARNRRESVSEELRLLYVALTRARERLILPLSYTSKTGENLANYAQEHLYFGGQTDLLTAQAGSMRDWLLMALILNPACEQLRRTLSAACETDSSQPFLSVAVIPPEQADADDSGTAGETEAVSQPDPALLETLRAQCAWHYDSPLASLPAKYGVSELAKAEDFSVPLHRPGFVTERHGLTGSERGTAVHAFLQYADMRTVPERVPAEIDRLQSEGRLTARQADAVRKSGIEAFFRSDLHERILNADKVWRERKFTVRLNDLHLEGQLSAIGEAYRNTEGMVSGIMDLVLEERDGIVLVDYKTDHLNSPAELLERYTEQIRIYAEALRLLMRKPVRACLLYSVYMNRTVPVEL
ncbi:MAG: UvrD-helicase domain-containing protein [Oscillospiraceae bacterium]|nr:UvrD-helicase domain-containing protein [Oscillospiraceae bacterium]